MRAFLNLCISIALWSGWLDLVVRRGEVHRYICMRCNFDHERTFRRELEMRGFDSVQDLSIFLNSILGSYRFVCTPDLK